MNKVDTKRSILFFKKKIGSIEFFQSNDELGYMDKIEVVSRVLNIIFSTLFMSTLSCQLYRVNFIVSTLSCKSRFVSTLCTPLFRLFIEFKMNRFRLSTFEKGSVSTLVHCFDSASRFF
jgi:hypothetical protein